MGKLCSECNHPHARRGETCSERCKSRRDLRLRHARKSSNVAAGSSRLGHPPSSVPPPPRPTPVHSTEQSIPTGHTLDLILDEVRALINLPHVLAVSITREGKVTALRGLPSEEDADDRAEAMRQIADLDSYVASRLGGDK